MKKANHYVDNSKFFEAMVEFKESVDIAKAEGKKRPPVSNYIGHCIMQIAVHLSQKPNFINYRFRDDMIGDAIINCFQYIDNFNPEKSKNPFAYFTQISYYAFLRRIDKEKKELYTKYKYMQQNPIVDEEFPEIEVKHTDYSQDYIDNFIQDFEEKKRREIRKRKKSDETE